MILNPNRFILCLACVFAISAPLAWAQATNNTARPNVVVILVDDMGWSDIGSYGGEIPTPNLDALATKGVRFTQFYNRARCSPTRASLITGLYPHQAGLGWLDNMVEPKSRGIHGKLLKALHESERAAHS